MKIIKEVGRTTKRLQRHHNLGRLIRLKVVKVRRISKNKRNSNNKNRDKFGVKIPNSVHEALIMDTENGNKLWGDAIAKEMLVLDKAKVFQYFPPHHKINKLEYQYTPLRMIFDVKAEDLRHKARLVAGGHVVNATMFEPYSSVVQTCTIRLLMIVTMSEELPFITGDIGNAFVHANTQEKIYTIAGRELGEQKDCMVIMKRRYMALQRAQEHRILNLGYNM